MNEFQDNFPKFKKVASIEIHLHTAQFIKNKYDHNLLTA
jgi:hypothetical protein